MSSLEQAEHLVRNHPANEELMELLATTSWSKLFGGKYVLFEDGKVWSYKHSKFLKPYSTPQGYLMFDLYDENDQRTRHTQHSLVGKWFVPKREAATQINHKNGDRTDNRKENLEWVTNAENNQHAYDVLGRVNAMKGRKKVDGKFIHIN